MKTFERVVPLAVALGAACGGGQHGHPTCGSTAWTELTIDGQRVFVPAAAGSSTPPVVQFFAQSATPVSLEVTGLEPWQAGDSLQVVSPNVALDVTSPDEPAAGATASTGSRVDWQRHRMIDAARGDVTWVTQSREVATPTSHYRSLVRAGAAKSFAVSDGKPATLTVELAPLAQDKQLALHWKGMEFAALAAQAGPDATAAAAPDIEIKAVATTIVATDPFQGSYFTDVASLVALGPISGAADDDENVTYGDPYGSGYDEVVTATYAIPVPVPTPQGVGTVQAMMVSATPTSALAGGVIAPVVTPVQAVTIGGQPANQPRTGVGVVPTLAWTAPATGTVTGYAVTVRAIATSATGVDIATVATIYTPDRSLAIPCNLLTAGGSYVFTITAIAAPGQSTPTAGVVPYASADYVTAEVSP
nr:hypothetical protein [Kofleriaceae bacterium]